MKDFDYSSNNIYFVTSCTHGSIHYFGEIKKGKMHLNEIGEIALHQWKWLAKQYPYTKSHAFVVMPNHIHGILEINRDFIVRTGRVVGSGRDLTLQSQQKIKSLSELMGAYKTTTSKKIHLMGYPDFAWQRSFHDHIIRNTTSYEKIYAYILNNPSHWEEDGLY
jgi:REP element-mobilizing transposase RayT